MQTGAMEMAAVVARASPLPERKAEPGAIAVPGPTPLAGRVPVLSKVPAAERSPAPERAPVLWRVAEPGRKGHPLPYAPPAGPFGMRRCPA